MANEKMMSEETTKNSMSVRGFDYTIIIPTANGLKKSVIDATASMRAFLAKNKLHDYASQKQGPDNKVFVPTYIVGKNGLFETNASLYRPKTKKGDPRIWFSGLPAFCKPLDQIAMLTDGRHLYLINISDENSETSLEALGGVSIKTSPPAAESITALRSESLSFSTNAKLGKLLGRELITNNTIAVFELIKNSYDAFASEVVIEFSDFGTDGTDSDLDKNKNQVLSKDGSGIFIVDNGIGMTFDDIKTKWMQVGTPSKEAETLREHYRDGRLVRRAINGEKGIGRFGTDKLGALLLMDSVAELSKHVLQASTLQINWDEFNDHSKDFQDFSFTCEARGVPHTADSKTGLTLRVAKLREKWTGGDILRLKKHMRKLISPFSQDQDDFKIYLKFGERLELVKNDSLDYADTGIEATLTQDGLMSYTLFDKEKKVYNDAQHPPPIFGPVNLRILYMDRNAKAAFTRANKFSFREYGNIKLFRDNFRIMPYGEQQNDWLGIDNKHAQAVFRTLGTRDIIGYIQISKEYNPQLKDATSRQGLNEDVPEYEAFKAFIWTCLDMLSNFIFERIKERAEQQGRLIEHEVVEIRDEITSFKREIPKLFDKLDISPKEKEWLIDRIARSSTSIEKNVEKVDLANKQLENQMSVMSQIAGTEHMLYDIIHAVKNRLSALEAIIGTIFTMLDIDETMPQRVDATAQLRELSTIVYTALKRTTPQRKERARVDLVGILEKYVGEQRMVYPQIDIQLEGEKDRPLNILCNSGGFTIMMDNLFSNSIKAMEKQKDKQIRIRLETSGRWATMFFSDNGPGVPPEKAQYIFAATFSTTGGTGIGLSSAAHYISEHGGTISYVKDSALSGATFKIALPLLK